jgi:hypothetical protein
MQEHMQEKLERSELRLKIEAKRTEIAMRSNELVGVKRITRQFKLKAPTFQQKLCEGANKEGKKRTQFAPALSALYRKSVGDMQSKVTDMQVEGNHEHMSDDADQRVEEAQCELDKAADDP